MEEAEYNSSPMWSRRSRLQMDELKKNMVTGLEKKTNSQMLGSKEQNKGALTFLAIFRCP